jgi:hypothetical protein
MAARGGRIDHWLEATLAVPFSNKQQAYTEYLDGLARMCRELMLLYGVTMPNDSEFESIRAADRHYTKAFEHFRLLAGNEHALRLKSEHEKNIPPDWREIGFTNFHKQEPRTSYPVNRSNTPRASAGQASPGDTRRERPSKADMIGPADDLDPFQRYRPDKGRELIR